MIELDSDNDDVSQQLLNLLTYGRCSEELATLYSQVLSIFNTVGFTAHIDELDLLTIQLNDHNIAPEEVVEAADSVIRSAADKAFSMIGVVVTHDIPIGYLAEALDILVNFDTTEVPETIFNMMEASEDPVEAILELLEYQGTYLSDDWMCYIESVDENTIKRIKKISLDEIRSKNTPTQAAIPTDTLRRVSKLNKYRKDTLGAELSVEGIGVGQSLESLYSLHVGRLIDMSLENAIDGIFSLAAISNVSQESLESEIGTCIDDLCYEAEMRRKGEQIRFKMIDQYKTIFGADHG